MDVATLHTAVRSLTRGGPGAETELPSAERLALRALRRRLRAVGLRMDRLVPPSGSRIWLAAPHVAATEPLNSVP